MNAAAGASAGASSATRRIKARALEIGFDAVGVAAADPPPDAGRYEAWLAAGHHGEMHYLATDRHRERRADLGRVLPGVRSVIVVALCHEPHADAARDARTGRVARYARGEDYHRVLRDRLRELAACVREVAPGARVLDYADTGAILERAWAQRAGLGWHGRNTLLISPRLGSYFLLGELLTDVALEPDAPFERAHCGTCDRCVAQCPTGAIVAPHVVDARRCISYLTIELRGPIPRELRPLVGDWIFGCDVCQEVCPWNRFAPPAREARLHARALPELQSWTLERFLGMDDATFAQVFATSPIRRAKRAGFLRNVCVALGNRGAAESLPALARALERDPEPLVRGHAAWAIGAVLERGAREAERDGVPGGDDRHAHARADARAALARACADPDAFVRDEAAAVCDARDAAGTVTG